MMADIVHDSHIDPQAAEWQTCTHSTGTSIIGCEFEGGVVVAADSRATTGSYVVNRVSDKLTRITDHIYCCSCGIVADAQAIADVASYHLNFHKMEMGKPPLVLTAASIFRELCYNYRDALVAGVLVAGWDSTRGGQNYSIPVGGTMQRQPVSLGGSGSSYVYGYVDANFKPGMTKEQAVKFVTNTLSLAMKRDTGSGGIIRLGVITENGVQRRMVLGEDLPKFYGTSVMACEFKDGVVMGADSRTTTGPYVANRVADKLTKITDHIYCCRSGCSADTQAVCDIVSYHLNFHKMELGEQPLVSTAASIFRELCYNYRDSLAASILVSGWDKTHGGQIYSIPLDGMMQRQAVSLGGSGSAYVYGYVDANFKKGMTKDEATQLVTNTLALAMVRDGFSGGVIRLCVLTENGVQKSVIPGDELPKFYEG